VSGGGGVFSTTQNAVPNKRQPGDSPEEQNNKQTMLDILCNLMKT